MLWAAELLSPSHCLHREEEIPVSGANRRRRQNWPRLGFFSRHLAKLLKELIHGLHAILGIRLNALHDQGC